MPVQIRVKAPSGLVRLEVEEDWTLARVVALIQEKTGISSFSLKYGYPLQDLDIPSKEKETVGGLQLRGESFVLVPSEQAAPPAARPSEPTSAAQQAPEEKKPFKPKGVDPDETVVEWPERGGSIVLRVMPDDNSCMFTAFGGALPLENPVRRLRGEVAEYIMNHPEEYSKVILGDDPARYIGRMKQMDTWGGAIELSILSDIYDIEICSIDVKSLRVDRFGENKSTRCILLYSGIHYDRIAFTMDLAHPVEFDVTQWATDDDAILDKARELAQKLQRLHYFTDTTDFVLKCGQCDWIGQGTRDAAKHERETGHSQFGEMEIQ